MRNLGGVTIMSALAMMITIGSSIEGRAQANKLTVHPAADSQVITVTVTDLVKTKHGKDAGGDCAGCRLPQRYVRRDYHL